MKKLYHKDPNSVWRQCATQHPAAKDNHSIASAHKPPHIPITDEETIRSAKKTSSTTLLRQAAHTKCTRGSNAASKGLFCCIAPSAYRKSMKKSGA